MYVVCATPQVNSCLFHGDRVMARFGPTPDLRLQSILDFLQVSCLAKTNKEVCRQKGSHKSAKVWMGNAKKKKTGSGSTFFFSVCLVTDLIDHLQGNRCGSRTISWKLL